MHRFFFFLLRVCATTPSLTFRPVSISLLCLLGCDTQIFQECKRHDDEMCLLKIVPVQTQPFVRPAQPQIVGNHIHHFVSKTHTRRPKTPMKNNEISSLIVDRCPRTLFVSAPSSSSCRQRCTSQCISRRQEPLHLLPKKCFRCPCWRSSTFASAAAGAGCWHLRFRPRCFLSV